MAAGRCSRTGRAQQAVGKRRAAGAGVWPRGCSALGCGHGGVRRRGGGGRCRAALRGSSSGRAWVGARVGVGRHGRRSNSTPAPARPPHAVWLFRALAQAARDGATIERYGGGRSDWPTAGCVASRPRFTPCRVDSCRRRLTPVNRAICARARCQPAGAVPWARTGPVRAVRDHAPATWASQAGPHVTQAGLVRTSAINGAPTSARQCAPRAFCQGCIAKPRVFREECDMAGHASDTCTYGVVCDCALQGAPYRYACVAQACAIDSRQWLTAAYNAVLAICSDTHAAPRAYDRMKRVRTST